MRNRRQRRVRDADDVAAAVQGTVALVAAGWLLFQRRPQRCSRPSCAIRRLPPCCALRRRRRQRQRLWQKRLLLSCRPNRTGPVARSQPQKAQSPRSPLRQTPAAMTTTTRKCNRQLLAIPPPTTMTTAVVMVQATAAPAAADRLIKPFHQQQHSDLQRQPCFVLPPPQLLLLRPPQPSHPPSCPHACSR